MSNQTDPTQQATLKFDATIPQLAFAGEEIRQVVAARSLPPFTAETKIDAHNLAAQCYRIERLHDDHFRVVGGDANGAMYGALDIAEAARLGTLSQLGPDEQAPHIAQRGIKFNLPLDVRTPSYSDAGDSARQNTAEIWSLEFWHEFLDEMARHRFNVLTLWNLHPFPSIVKVPEYPDVALDDVLRTTVKPDTSFNLSGTNMLRPEMLDEVETLKKISIEEKIDFWREVMQYAQDRGIDVYLFTWNIFVWGTDGKYGITAKQDNPITVDYFRKSVRETLLTYPLLKGFGITSGESMRDLKGEYTREKWLWKTYGEGMADAKREQPERSMRLIHRFHLADPEEINKEWENFPDAFDFSFKYSVAHMYSAPNPPFAKTMLENLPPHQRTWLTVRNDDIYSFRWFDPQYARDYILGMPGPDKLAGFYMGPDGYIWGREFISTEPETPRQLVIKKQHLSFMLWGRLSYNPSLPDSWFEKILAARFPEAPADKLLMAFESASKVIPQINRFFWRGNGGDFEWFPEACIHHPGGSEGFYSVVDFMKGQTMRDSNILNIETYVEARIKQEPQGSQTPLQVAQHLKHYAATTFQLLSEMPAAADKELRLSLGDLSAMAHLGNYYAEKILGAVELALFEKSGQGEHQTGAIEHLEAALEHWKKYAATYSRQYLPQHLTRVGYVDVNALTSSVQHDIEIARSFNAAPI